MIRKIAGRLVGLLPFLVIILAAGQIWITNELAGLGASVHDVDVRIEAIKEENALLTQQVASASSLLLIEQKAREMGFVDPDKSSFLLLSDLPLAFGQLR